uniref:Autophagy-related protein 16 domain-containing protein n=1 Tax=Clastoptera arizonana TaxID=38151 RepID=A0A1B6DA44_9HEMI
MRDVSVTSMAADGEVVSSTDWRNKLFSQLQNRNRQQCLCFQDLITFHNQLFDRSKTLRHENLQLTIKNEKLLLEIQGSGTASRTGNVASSKISALEQKNP